MDPRVKPEDDDGMGACPPEQFQEKWKPVFRPELRKIKKLDQFTVPRNGELI
jgi:hypothetical protein